MIQRFFRADESVYELVRSTLDSAWLLPAHGQVTCLEPAASAPRGDDGRVYLGTWSTFCEYDDVGPLLQQLLDVGSVEEISEEQYRQAVEIQTP